MSKIITLILIVGVMGGGVYFYKKDIKSTPAEGTPIGYGFDKDDKDKVNKKSFTVTFPNASSVLIPGEKVVITWNNTGFDLRSTYPVTLVNVDDKNKKPINIGKIKYIMFNKSLVWIIPKEIASGNYKIVFGGKMGGESQVFKIQTSTSTPSNNPGPAVFTKVSSEISTIKNNNIDVGVNVSFSLLIKPEGDDVYASGTKAVVVLKDIATGKVISEKIVNGVTESGLLYFQDSSTKHLNFSVVFPASVFPTGITNVKASIYSINYVTVGSVVAPSTTYTALDFGLYDTGITSVTGTAPTTPATTTTSMLFTRNLVAGDSGADVTALQQILLTKGFSNIAPTGYFGRTTTSALKAYQVSIGISPADGYFGPKTRAVLNAELSKIQ